jgi:hypothetical protein
MLPTLMFAPLAVNAPFQIWDMDSPLVKVQVTVQLLIAAEPAVTVTSPWKLPDQELVTWYAARQPPVGGVGDAVGDRLGVGDGDADRVGVGLGDADRVGVGDGLVRVGVTDGVGEVPPPLPGPIPVTWPLPPSNTTSEQP